MKQNSNQNWHKVKILCIIQLLTTTALGFSPVYAQSAQDEPFSLDLITVEADEESDEKRENDVYDASSSSVFIPLEELDRYGNRTPGQILRGQPGVQVGDARNGGALDVNIRGVQGQERVVVKVDGSEQSLETYRGYAGTQNRSYVDPQLISQVQVNKGPRVDAASSGAIGGTVNMYTLRPEDVLLDGKKFGILIRADKTDSSIEPQLGGVSSDGNSQRVGARDSYENLFNSPAWTGSIATAYKGEKFEFVAAYARNNQGNYFAGKNGRDRYRVFVVEKALNTGEIALDENGNPIIREERNTVVNKYKEGEEVMNSAMSTRSILLKGIYRPTDDQKMQLTYRNFDAEIAEIMPSEILRNANAELVQWPKGSVKSNSYTFAYSYNPANNDLINLRANLWMSDANTRLLNGGPKAPESQSSGFNSNVNWSSQHSQRIGGDITNKSNFDTAYGAMSVELGTAYKYEIIEPQDGVKITQDDLNNNDLIRNGTRNELSLSGKITWEPTENLSLYAGAQYINFSTEDKNTKARELFEYKTIYLTRYFFSIGQARWFPDENGDFTDATNPLLNNGEVTLSDGTVVNADDVEFNGQNVYNGPSAGYKYSDPVKRKSDGFAPAFGISYKLDENQLVYATYNEALRMPSLFESSLGTLSVEPTNTLKPERSRTIEIGYSTALADVFTQGDYGRLKVSYFRNYIENYSSRYFEPAKPGEQAPAMTFSNADMFKSSGIELQTSYSTDRYFTDLSTTYYLQTETCDAAWAENLRARAYPGSGLESTPDCTAGGFAGSYVNTQNPPKLSLNLGGGLNFMNGALTVGGRMSYTTGPTHKLDKPWNNQGTTFQLPYVNVAVFDLFANYKVSERAQMFASIENVTDRYYLDPLAQSMMPAPGRNFRVGLSVKF